MASREFNEEKLQAGRTEDLTFTIVDKDGDALTIAADDVVHFRLTASRGGAAVLSIASGTPTDNGSDVTISALSPAAGTIQLAEEDTKELSGLYFAELDLEDMSEADPERAMKPFLRGTIRFQPNSPLE